MCQGEPLGLRAHSGDARLLARLHAPAPGPAGTGPYGFRGTGAVHSAFTHVVNLLTPDGLLIALASRDAGDAPRTLVVDVPDWTGTGLDAGHSVMFDTGRLILDAPGRPLHLTAEGARPWDPAGPSLAHLAPGALARAADALDAYNRAHGAPGGMLGAAPGAGLMESAVARALDAGRVRLLDALRAGDAVETVHGILALHGLGPGLTPAGDDFLAGLTLVAALPGSALAPLPPAVRTVLDGHRGRTTDLAAATLTEAAEGRARAELIDVLRQLADSPPPWDLNDPARRVLAFGHTSGSDTLSGLVAGLHLEEELRGSL
ncbi:oxamate carbamoyltransferase subunit AllH family protein [Streptomyces xanthii]|uniref:DUF2877 domain-containing protein n=1 Tax=Streptomyces xanthii TaxID=2768069 RepID=A0A7H1BGS8_9ACTN|nr:DUF2877 domain-containing protein [Streptomyces xanthii]QNS07933.1 DUF2877 domain-containing protein [Streptomyces xanthii]